MLFLKILAAVFISMLLIVALLYFWVKWRLRRAFRRT